MRPVISYYGGKQRIARHIVAVIRTIPHTVYAEPFAGGAAVLFAKGRPHNRARTDYPEFINDHDERIVNLYRVCQTQEADLLHLLKYTPYSKSEHRKAAAILNGDTEADDLWRAWALVVSIRQGFAHNICDVWSVSATSVNRAVAWANYLDALPAILARLRGVNVACEDAIRFIERWDRPDTLFYCDPPYPGTNQGHYGGYTLEDFQALCNALDSISGSYILSNYPQSIEPKSAQQRIEIATMMSAAKDPGDSRKRTEVLWVCSRGAGGLAQQAGMW